MFFRRKKRGTEEDPAPKQLQRTVPQDFSQFRVTLESHEGEVYRGEADGALVVQVDSQMREPVQGRLVDLSIQGISMVVALSAFPALTEGEILGVRIEHMADEWRISTPGMVRVIAFEDGRWVRIGLEFVNPGNLFAQLENDRGQYFNRRRESRVNVDPALEVTVRQRGVRLHLVPEDLSVCGVGGWADHVQASMLKLGPMRLRIKPREGELIEGPAELVYKRRANERDRLGVAFDIAAWDKSSAERLTELVEHYLAERFRWTG